MIDLDIFLVIMLIATHLAAYMAGYNKHRKHALAKGKKAYYERRLRQ